MPPEPDVVLVDGPSFPAADSFWHSHCQRLPLDQLQFVGLDLDFWLQVGQNWVSMADWVKDLRECLATKSKPERVFVTTIIALMWPIDPKTYEELDASRPVVTAGANLRLKWQPVYDRGRPVQLDQFKLDLELFGWLRPADDRPLPIPLPEPSFNTVEDETDYKSRLEFYGDPPFRWPRAEVEALFRKKPPTP